MLCSYIVYVYYDQRQYNDIIIYYIVYIINRNKQQQQQQKLHTHPINCHYLLTKTKILD